MTNFSKIKWYNCLDSTNNQALREIESLENMSVIATVLQTHGRGQRGNNWTSQDGENLTFSLVLNSKSAKSTILAKRQYFINILVCLGIYDFLKKKGIEVKFKWPNDIYFQDKKMCGILIENALNGEKLQYSIIGIGLNINQLDFDKKLPNPISLSLVTGVKYELKESLEELYSCLVFRLNELENIEDEAVRGKLFDLFSEKLYRLDEYHHYISHKDGMEKFQAKIIGIDKNFRLILQNKVQGEIKKFYFKEIEFCLF